MTPFKLEQAYVLQENVAFIHTHMIHSHDTLTYGSVLLTFTKRCFVSYLVYLEWSLHFFLEKFNPTKNIYVQIWKVHILGFILCCYDLVSLCFTSVGYCLLCLQWSKEAILN